MLAVEVLVLTKEYCYLLMLCWITCCVCVCVATATSAGAVYLYRMGSNSGLWKEKQKLVPTEDVEGYELFGTSLAVWENTLVVGSAGGQVDGECWRSCSHIYLVW
jgi:hypothetical protein